jgi:hypothetical protein
VFAQPDERALRARRAARPFAVQLAALAKSEGISINQLIATAAAEKLAALTTEEYLKARAKRSSRAKFKGSSRYRTECSACAGR